MISLTGGPTSRPVQDMREFVDQGRDLGIRRQRIAHIDRSSVRSRRISIPRAGVALEGLRA